MNPQISAVRSILASTPGRWTILADATPTELLARQPAPGQWSALACLQHLVDTERKVFPVRVEAFLAGRDFAAYDPDADGAAGSGAPAASALAREFGELRAESLRAIDSLADTDLSRTARHAELGLVTLAELLNEWAAHDLNHTIQAERAVMQLFIPASGPWRSYFADHDVAR